MLVSGAAPESIFIIAGVGRTLRVLSELLHNSQIFLLTKIPFGALAARSACSPSYFVTRDFFATYTNFGALSATYGCYRVSLRKLAELYANTHPL